MKVDINSIARAAGVSTTTVSNFINATETIPISPEKQERIREAMRRTRYRPNSASSLLRRKRVLPGKGVFVFGSHLQAPPYDLIRNPMLGETLTAIDHASATTLGLRLEVRGVADAQAPEDWNALLIDAEYVLCYGYLDRLLYLLSERKNIPLIVIGEGKEVALRGDFTAPPLIDRVYWNAHAHLAALLDHLHAQGTRRVYLVSSWNIRANHPQGFALEAEAKMQAFRDYLAAHPDMHGEILSPPRIPDDLDLFHESRGAFALLRQRPAVLERADAILGHNDIVAQGVIAALRAAGRTPGRDVLVTGEGDFAEYRYLVPAVTTIGYDRAALAQQICDLLSRRLEDNRPRGINRVIPSQLLRRETA